MSMVEPRDLSGGSPTVSDGSRLFLGGERLHVAGDRPFLLQGSDAWLVVAGQVDVFTVELGDGAPVGPRRHLLRVPPGQTLFGIGPTPLSERWGLLAVGAKNTELVRVERAALGRAAGQVPTPRVLAPLVEAWVQAIYESMTRDKLPAISVELESGREVEVAPGTSVRPRGELIWVRHEQGYSHPMGRRGLEFRDPGFLPLSRRAWLEAGEASRLATADTAELGTLEELWRALGNLHDLLLHHVDLSQRESEGVALARLRQKGAYREAVLKDSCERLAATMTPGDSAAGPVAAGSIAVEDLQDPLFAALTIVGANLGLAIKAYPRGEGMPVPRDPLAATLRASRVRARQVALRERWWTFDNGPMLAYLGADKRPVALLLNPSNSGYVLHDPQERTRVPLTPALAEQLEPFAQALYRPFPDTRVSMRDVIRFGLQGCRRDIGVLIAVSLCTTLLSMIPSYATGMLFNTIIPGAQRSQLFQMLFVLLACALATALFSLGQGVALLRIEGRASGALQSGVWDRLLSLPLPFFRPYTAGDLAQRAMSIDAMRQVISGTTAQALMGGFVSLGNFFLMYWYSWRMAAWATLIIAVFISVALAGSYLQLAPQRQSMLHQSKASGIVLQLLSSIAKIRVAGVEVPAFALWVRRFSEQRRHQYRARSISKWVTAFNSAVPLMANAIIYYIALPLITETRELGTGDFLAFMSAFSTSSSALLSTSLALLATLNTIPLYEQAKPILDALPEVDPAKSDPGVLTGDIEIQHAMFRYHQDGPLVLRDISLHIKPGQFVAFVGPSGSGKSTMLRLLLGFETLEAGAVYFDGQELGGVDVQAVRRQMGVVLQSGRLLSGDIFTNIVGSASASIDEAWGAARMAGLEDDIKAMPMGMHTVISEGGGTLSGGQRQRLLIARAMVHRPRILLFDEATSALDNRTQAIVSASLERLQATRIVVAHRLSTIINADRIVVFEKGRIVESGTYAELVEQNGPFAELAKRQIA